MSICLCIYLHHVPHFGCLVTVLQFQQVILAWQTDPVKHPGWMYTIQGCGTCCHDTDGRICVTLPLTMAFSYVVPCVVP